MGILYVTGNVRDFSDFPVLHAIIWIWYMVEMIVRLLIPTDLESMGCQKVFVKNYKAPKVEREPKISPGKLRF
jgi:hypothetical protein